jgi:hypothetical protein
VRARGADVRAELMNAMYALSRGLATVAAVLTVTFASVGIARWTERMIPAVCIAAAASLLFLYRFNRFGFYFADQVWRDYAASVARQVGVVETPST